MTFYEALTIALSGAALLTSLAVLYLSDKQSIKTNKWAIRANDIAQKANEKAIQANTIATQGLQISIEDHKAKYFPLLEGAVQVLIQDVENYELDEIRLSITNLVNSEIHIENIDIGNGVIFSQKEKDQCRKGLFNKPDWFGFWFSKEGSIRSVLVEKIKGTYLIDEHITFENRLEDQIKNYLQLEPIFVRFTYQDIKCVAYLRYSNETQNFLGKSIKLT